MKKEVLTIRFLRHIDKQDKEFWETCSLVRYDDLEKVKERLYTYPDQVNQKTANGITLLYFSQTERMAAFLIEQGLSVHEKDEWGNTPLHLAAYEGFTGAATIYIQNGADVHATNRWGQKPHQIASTPATCDVFITNRQNAQKRIDQNLQDVSLYDAARQGKEQAIRYMLASGVDPNLLNHEDFQVDRWEDTPLYHAIYIGYHRIVDLLLQYGANPNVHSGVSLYRSAYNVATIQALHKYGAKATPAQLDDACWEAVVNVGNNAMLQELISYGAPLDKDYIIHDAIRRVDQTTEEYPKIVRTLVEHRPEFLDSISKIDETPLLKAVDMNNQLMVECLIELGADVNKPNKKNVTPLLSASRRGNTTLVKWLIEQGADVISTDDTGLSAYTWAVFNRRSKTIEAMRDAMEAKELPIPKTPLPPKPEDFHHDTSDFTHFFHDDDWNDAVFIRWNQNKFLKFAYQLGFHNRYVAIHETPADQVTYFFSRDELILQTVNREEIMTVTQYFAFHPDYPDAWMTYINWWDEESDVDYTQFHFRCPNELLEETRNIIQEEDLITKFTLDNIEEDHPVRQLYTYSEKCLQTGLDELWQTSFYNNEIS
jgi:ankyrin repeat protein